MYCKYVTVKILGAVFKVWVSCTPYTPLKELEERAIQILSYHARLN